MEAIKTVAAAFAEALRSAFALPGQAAPEDQLKQPVSDLVKAVGAALGLDIQTQTEAQIPAEKVRPDIAVYVKPKGRHAHLITGYLELKQPGLGADAARLSGAHNRAQWEKLRNLPNLIYTDGRDWTLYRRGERIATARFTGDPVAEGAKAVQDADMEALKALIEAFLRWQPMVPHRPKELAEFIAPLARFLRAEVEAALPNKNSAIAILAQNWRDYLFRDADDARFADSYAQTVTYALLLARLHGADDLAPGRAAAILGQDNSLLAQALRVLGHRDALDELRVGFELLKRSLEALDPAEFLRVKPELWLYFYEDFLAAYDPKLRRDYGVYYTPREVVELQVRLATELLESRFGRKLGFADDGVVFLDPAVGTGTYLVAAVKHGLERVRARSGEGAVPGRARQMAENMYGFEILVGPYAVAHLRLTQALEGEGAKLENRLKIYLADTLESPHAKPPWRLSLDLKPLADEHEAARRVKSEGEILVCLGNPPYDRQHIEEGDTTTRRKGGWVRFGDPIEGGARPEEQGERPILEDFLEPARRAGAGRHLQVIFNDYVYFWRWALWRMFEQQDCGGIVTFITASSYLAGPGFLGMREVMRRTFDELWLLDLGGDNRGARKTPNVFAARTPVAIAIGVRGREARPEAPARAHYARITGATREEKLAKLEAIAGFAAVEWQDCPDDWHAPFLPKGKGKYFEWPTVTSLFPFHTAGAIFYRTWPIAETPEVLRARWRRLASAKREERAELFKESRDRKITYIVRNEALPGGGQPPISDVTTQSREPNIIRYGFRSFDRQFAFYDFRLGDFLRPALYTVYSDEQLFLITPDSMVIGVGPAMVATPHIPDQHHFCGRGSRDVIPLYRDAAATRPNVTAGLLDRLAAAYGAEVTAEDLAAYVYALLGGRSYTRRFWNELETPGPRVPVTKDGALFARAARLGRRLIWLHTYAERMRGEDRGDTIPPGTAKCIAPIPDDPARYPERFEYRPAGRELIVGEGRVGPVAPEVWAFEVSGLEVVKSWLGYRMKRRAGRKSSPLDDIRPERWTPRMTDELLELLWVIEATLGMEPELEAALDAVVAGECFTAAELPEPTEAERRPPRAPRRPGTVRDLFDDGEGEEDGEDGEADETEDA